jgi:hypothetical protein
VADTGRPPHLLGTQEDAMAEVMISTPRRRIVSFFDRHMTSSR